MASVESGPIKVLDAEMNRRLKHNLRTNLWVHVATGGNVNSSASVRNATRLQSLSSVLDFEFLNSLKSWDDGTAAEIAQYMHSRFPKQLKMWIEDENRWKLDPTRVEEVENAVRCFFEPQNSQKIEYS
jgi:hypothetical protein